MSGKRNWVPTVQQALVCLWSIPEICPEAECSSVSTSNQLFPGRNTGVKGHILISDRFIEEGLGGVGAGRSMLPLYPGKILGNRHPTYTIFQ